MPQFDALPWGAHRRFALTDDALFEACGVRIAFTGRAGGESEGPYASLNLGAHVNDDLECVAHNRRTVLNAIGANGAPLITLNQVHGSRLLHIADYPDVGRVASEAFEGADALEIDVKGIATMLFLADCLGFVVVAPSGRFVAGHAGWRGTVAHIAKIAALALAQGGEGSAANGLECGADGASGTVNGNGAAGANGAETLTNGVDGAVSGTDAAANGSCGAGFVEDPATFNVYISPHIGVECFEVGEEVAAQFVAEFGDEVVPSERHVSLACAVTKDFVSVGINPERIIDCGICTVCNSDEYFSYRASGGTCGRHAAVAYRA